MKQEQLYSLNVTTENPNPLIRWFFRWKFRKAIKMLNPKREDVVLDFGCGEKYLRDKIGDTCDVICYDKNPLVTEVDEMDYIGSYTNKIFAFDVLEHLTKEELYKVFENFKRMNPEFEMIIVTSNETWIWRLLRKVLMLPNLENEHKSNLKDILEVCKYENLDIENKYSFFGLSYLYKIRQNILNKEVIRSKVRLIPYSKTSSKFQNLLVGREQLNKMKNKNYLNTEIIERRYKNGNQIESC